MTFATVGGPHLTYIFMAFYFSILLFGASFSCSEIFYSTRASTTKNIIFGVLTFDPFISTNISSQLVPKIWRHAPGHCACCLPTISLRRYLHHLWIRNKSFHQKMTSLWMRCHWNCRPTGSLWASLHHIQFTRRRYYRRRTSPQMLRPGTAVQ